MPRYKLIVEYDGTRYSGWQVQQNSKTVQGMLMSAARTAFGQVGEMMGSGRTDAGVHALGQVVHLDLARAVPSERILYGFNDNLPYDINVREAVPVAGRFHARHDAAGRSYLYQISRRRTAFGKQYVWWIKDELDLGAMRRAALAAVGMHDYAPFSDNEPGEGSTKVLVESVELVEAGNLILIRIRASHFLRKMVRRVVGTLAGVGRGIYPVEIISGALEGERGKISDTAPPSGLFLEQVKYAGEAYYPDLLPAVAIGRERR